MAETSTNEPKSLFQPGQVGLRHLLGATTVVALGIGLSAPTIRLLPTMRQREVAAHWAAVAAIAALLYWKGAVERRTNRQQAGQVLVRAMRIPLNATQRTLRTWLWTVAVLADWVVMSTVVLPQTGLWDIGRRNPTIFVLVLAVQGALWGYCLDHWLTNVYWIEFCERGLLTHGKYYPWETITRIGWSPAKPGRLFFLQKGQFQEMTIDPAQRPAVAQFLDRLSKPSPLETN